MDLHPEQLVFLPLSHSIRGEQKSGISVDSPQKCDECVARECEDPAGRVGEVATCRFGFNFVRLDANAVINGFLITDQRNPLRTWAKNYKRFKANRVKPSELDSVLSAARGAVRVTEKQLRRRVGAAVREYRNTPEFKAESFAHLSPEVERQLGQVHDYRALVGTIVQNVNVLLNARSQTELDAKLDEASREIQAIYWAARYMETKLNAALYLEYPERVRDPRRVSRFRFHGLIRKYEKMYEGAFEERGIRITRTGQCFGDVRCNGDALAVIPHAFIDNALKYSPTGGEVAFEYSEDETTVAFGVSSWGPQIFADEREKIFELFERGRAAEESESEGTGFGLALAKTVADQIGLELHVRQQDVGVDERYWTTFTLVSPKA